MTSAAQNRPRRYAAETPLPKSAYLPGINKRPHEEEHAHPDPAEIARFDAGDWSSSPRYLLGVDLFNHGFYWEAHEAWESIWIDLPKSSAGRELLQGLIQTAAALLKHRLGQPEAARMLEQRAQAHFELVEIDALEREGGRIMGVDMERVLEELREALDRPTPRTAGKVGQQADGDGEPHPAFRIELVPAPPG